MGIKYSSWIFILGRYFGLYPIKCNLVDYDNYRIIFQLYLFCISGMSYQNESMVSGGVTIINYRVPTKMYTFLRALSFMAPKVVSDFYQPIFVKFHIEIADDTFQSLGSVIGQNKLKWFTVIFKIYLWFCSYWFLVFFLKCGFPFLHLKRAHGF